MISVPLAPRPPGSNIYLKPACSKGRPAWGNTFGRYNHKESKEDYMNDTHSYYNVTKEERESNNGYFRQSVSNDCSPLDDRNGGRPEESPVLLLLSIRGEHSSLPARTSTQEETRAAWLELWLKVIRPRGLTGHEHRFC